jgi:hypothetical protein
MRTIGITGFAVALTLALVSVLAASVSFMPPGGTKKMLLSAIPLLAQTAAPKASGTVTVVSDMEKKNGTLTLQAKGLTPGKVYTVHFMKTVTTGGKSRTTMQGVGTAPYTLTVDSKGNGQMMYQPPSIASMMAWQRIGVFMHPDNKPTGTNMTPVLLGDLSKLAQ